MPSLAALSLEALSGTSGSRQAAEWLIRASAQGKLSAECLDESVALAAESGLLWLSTEAMIDPEHRAIHRRAVDARLLSGNTEIELLGPVRAARLWLSITGPLTRPVSQHRWSRLVQAQPQQQTHQPLGYQPQPTRVRTPPTPISPDVAQAGGSRSADMTGEQDPKDQIRSHFWVPALRHPESPIASEHALQVENRARPLRRYAVRPDQLRWTDDWANRSSSGYLGVGQEVRALPHHRLGVLMPSFTPERLLRAAFEQSPIQVICEATEQLLILCPELEAWALTGQAPAPGDDLSWRHLLALSSLSLNWRALRAQNMQAQVTWSARTGRPISEAPGWTHPPV